MFLPCALVSSCCQSDPFSIIKLVLNSSAPDAVDVLEGIKSYKWPIDTRYYTADVSLCTTENRTIGNATFAESVQAVILLCNFQQLESFTKLKSWLPFLLELNPEIQMVVCDRTAENFVVPRSTVQRWCLDHAFELVELDPDMEEVDEEETVGSQRITQALEAHTWPNLVLKDKPKFRSELIETLMQQQATGKMHLEAEPEVPVATDAAADAAKLEAPVVTDAASDAWPLIADDDVEGGFDDDFQPFQQAEAAADTSDDDDASSHADEAFDYQALDEAQEQDVAKEDPAKDHAATVDPALAEDLTAAEETASRTFEDLFQNINAMKSQADSLSRVERRAFAEKVVLDFWRAIGGDDAEVAGLLEEFKAAEPQDSKQSGLQDNSTTAGLQDHCNTTELEDNSRTAKQPDNHAMQLQSETEKLQLQTPQATNDESKDTKRDDDAKLSLR